MRILIGCEYSGTVREAFRKLEARHQVYSCDLLPSDDNSPFHIVGDVRDIIENHGPWDLIIIHPPCTALAVSGNRHYGVGKPKHNKCHNSIHKNLIVFHYATFLPSFFLIISRYSKSASSLCFASIITSKSLP